MKHTPGPWTSRSAGGVVGIVSEHGIGVADCVYRQADRALISAAPDMLAICSRLLELIDSGDIPNVGDWKEGAQLRAVIAQATGETTP